MYRVHSLILWFLQRAVLAGSISLLFGGCASERHHTSYRSQVVEAPCPKSSQSQAELARNKKDSSYYLHVLEFDDQGWAFTDQTEGDDGTVAPASRIDCAIDHLEYSLEAGKEVLTYVYVHGWHHTGEESDSDLIKFRTLLRKQYQRHGPERRVIGFYIAWNGESINFPVLSEMTFWGRKNAAHHVSEGSVREFFARLKAVRNYWNRPNNATDIIESCNRKFTGDKVSDANGSEVIANLRHAPNCPIRTVMIGHSFGAWILYAATSPYVLEVLSSGRDIPSNSKKEKTERERGIADLILLLNPAFEASRYDAVFSAASKYTNTRYELPLLVSLTSEDDDATRKYFPIARAINSALQYPATSNLESRAMKRTHGHMDEYLTHDLRLNGNWSNAAEDYDPCPHATDSSNQIEDAQELRKLYVDELKRRQGDASLEQMERRFCGGLTLRWRRGPLATPHSIVWNIRTDAKVITGHNGIHNRPLEYFIEQLYEDLSEVDRFKFAKP